MLTISQRASRLERFSTTLHATMAEQGRARPVAGKPHVNLTILRATHILTAAGVFPSERILVTDNKCGRVKHNRVASIIVSAGDDVDAITSNIDAVLNAAGYAVGWYSKSNGDKQTAYQTTV